MLQYVRNQYFVPGTRYPGKIPDVHTLRIFVLPPVRYCLFMKDKPLSHSVSAD